MNKTEDERDLHLVGVEELDLVLGDLPDRIESHVIGIHLVHRRVARIQHYLLRCELERTRRARKVSPNNSRNIGLFWGVAF